MSKQEKVEEHLIKYGHITSWEAIQLYRATRLSAIIYNLKKKGYVISGKMNYHLNKGGDKSVYKVYTLVAINKEIEQYNGEIDMSHIPEI